MSPVHRIPVRLKPHGYEVIIGHHHIRFLGKEIARLKLGTHPFVLTNPTLLRNHAQRVIRSMQEAGFSVQTLSVADTEKSKSLETLSRLLKELADLDRPGRRSFLVLVGGGVVGDVGGVVAGLYQRGIPYVHVPTTLLAQVDSSIGGKTAVDLPQGKNLAGLFYQPRLVFAEAEFLKTLPARQFRSGLAEVIKCAVIQDRNLFTYLERTPLSRLHDPKNLAWLIARAAAVKVSLIEKDERERLGLRTLLNFGHTLGHALETATNYDGRYSHGEAIAVGMCVATDIAEGLDQMPHLTGERIEHLIRKVKLPTTLRGVPLAQVTKAMAHDKKWVRGQQTWVLPTRIGKVVVRKNVPEEIVHTALLNRLEG